MHRKAIFAVTLLLILLVCVASVWAEPVTIRFNYRGGVQQNKAVDEWIAEFEKENPDINVEWENPTSDWYTKIIVQMATGSAPDVTEFWGTTAQELGRQGLLLDLRPYVKRDYTQADIADIYPPQWQNSTVQVGPYKGEQFAMPRYTNTMVTYYNQTYFQEAGLENPNSLERRGAWNWDMLRLLSQKLTVRNGDKVTRYGFATNNTNWFRVVQFAWEAGGDFFDATNPSKYVGDQPGAVRGMTFLQDMIWKDKSAMATFDGNGFPKGTVAIADDGISEVFSRERVIQDTFEWDMAPRAKGPVGRRPVTIDDGLGIWRGTKYPDAAWKFVKFLSSKKGQEILVKQQSLAPVRRSVLPVYMELSKKHNLGVIMESMMNAQMVITSRTAGDIRKISDAIGYQVLVPAMRENKQPYETLAKAVRPAIEQIMAESGK